MSYVASFNADQENAHDEVFRNQVTFVNGAGGTGKSYLIEGLSEKYAALVFAPTNAAALNVNGRTLHSGLGIALGVLDPRNDDVDEENFRALRLSDATNIRAAELLIIDEISMVRADLLDAVDRRLRDIRRVELSFGGVRTVLVGDPYQLRPVLGDRERSVFHEVGLWESTAWYDAAVIRELREAGTLGYAELFLQERQATDERFARALNHARVGRITAEDLDYLNRRHVGKRPKDMPALYFQRSKVEEDNRRHLSRLSGPTFRYERVVTSNHGVTWDKDNDPPLAVELRVGALVVMTSNNREWVGEDEHVLHWVNGDCAHVVELNESGVEVRIDRTGERHWLPAPHVAKRMHELGEGSVYPFVKEQRRYDEVNGTKRKTVEARAYNMPVRVASAMTVHKAQGQTLTRAFVGSGLGRQPGLAYVAVSRLRSLDGLHLERRLSPGSFRADDAAFEFVTALQKAVLL